MIRVAILLSLFLFACQEPSPTTIFQGAAMTVPYRITVGHPLTKKERDAIATLIENCFDEINQIYNKWNPDSELSQLNVLSKGETVQLSDQLYSFLVFTNEMVQLTEGRFDPTVEGVQRVWRTHLEEGTMPSISILPPVGWENIHFDNRVFQKEQSEISLDLGGVAKGYCVDCLVEFINKAGYSNVLVDWGGELKATGQHPEGRPWKIFIRGHGSVNPSDAIATLDLNNQAIATSGDYLQYWNVEVDGKELTFCHVIDPRTRQPLEVTENSVSSVTVTGESCAAADAIATAAMLFASRKEAGEWLESLKKEFPAMEYWIN